MRIIEISGIHFTMDPKTKAYIEKKVMKLVDYIPRACRKSATAEVRIKKNEARGGDKLECEMIINLPGKKLVAKENRDGVLATIDGAESKLVGQIRRYKIERMKAREQEGILSRVKSVLRRK
jgi:ribosomal subunit interface protein